MEAEVDANAAEVKQPRRETEATVGTKGHPQGEAATLLADSQIPRSRSLSRVIIAPPMNLNSITGLLCSAKRCSYFILGFSSYQPLKAKQKPRGPHIYEARNEEMQ